MDSLGPELDKHVNALAAALFDLLQPFESGKRIFILSAAMQICNRRLQSRESSRFRLDLTRDRFPSELFPSEPPTVPDQAVPPEVGRYSKRPALDRLSDSVADMKAKSERRKPKT